MTKSKRRKSYEKAWKISTNNRAAQCLEEVIEKVARDAEEATLQAEIEARIKRELEKQTAELFKEISSDFQIIGNVYKSIKHYYQASKFFALCGPTFSSRLASVHKPAYVKKFVRRILAERSVPRDAVEKWKKSQGLTILNFAIHQKIGQNPSLAKRLIETEKKILDHALDGDGYLACNADEKKFLKWAEEHNDEILKIPWESPDGNCIYFTNTYDINDYNFCDEFAISQIDPANDPNLVAIHDAFTNRFLAQQMLNWTQNQNSLLWLGAVTVEHNTTSSFQHWLDGTPIDYKNFVPGTPSTFNTDMDLLMNATDGYWYPIKSSDIRAYYICQEPKSYKFCGEGWTYKSDFNKCFGPELFDQANVTEAQRNCMALNASLPAIHSGDEDYVISTLLDDEIDVWISLYRTHVNGTWQWFDNSLVNYTNFDYPFNQDNPNGLYVYKDIEKNWWYTTDENELYNYICTKYGRLD
uniref:C-type lectin domain-containing protein n=1 Tax=Acrobeloides nanus TaxID=290746 RepID=A0A914CHE9_9BILA